MYRVDRVYRPQGIRRRLARLAGIGPCAIVAVVAAGIIVGCDARASADRSDLSEAPAYRALESASPLAAVRLAAHVEHLASSDLAGRFPGTPGIDLAERYIADWMARLGLEPLDAARGYFHEVGLYRSNYDPNETRVRVGRATDSAPGIRPLFLSDAGSVEGPLVFAGYGITAPEHEWDDYGGLDVRDRIVFIYRYEPAGEEELSRFAGARHSDHALFATKAANARDRGARGMILVTGPEHHEGPEDLRAMRTLSLDPHSLEQRFARSRLSNFVAVQVSQKLMQEALRPYGIDLARLQQDLEAGTQPSEVHLEGLSANVSVGFTSEAEPIRARNVAGFLPATEPGGSESWIVVGAHHDHLGSFGLEPSQIYHGADDNASGVAGLLELAAHFADRPRARNLAFVTFTAEEEGLLGSRVFARDEILPPEEMELMINLDMLGRNPDEPVRFYLSEAAVEHASAIEAAARARGLEVSVRRGVAEPVSDHYPFHRAGIPVVSVFTGLHDDYHQATDTADRLDYERMELIVTVIAELVEGAYYTSDDQPGLPFDASQPDPATQTAR